MKWGYASILEQEAAIAQKKKQLEILRTARGAQRLLGVHKNPLLQAGEKMAADALNKSLREMRSQLVRSKQIYRSDYELYCTEYGTDFKIHHGSHYYGHQSPGMRI